MPQLSSAFRAARQAKAPGSLLDQGVPCQPANDNRALYIALQVDVRTANPVEQLHYLRRALLDSFAGARDAGLPHQTENFGHMLRLEAAVDVLVYAF